MPVSIIPEDHKKKYLDYFKDKARFKIPFRDPHDFNVHEHFFDNLCHARKSLVALLDGISFPAPTYELAPDVYAEFTVTAHAAVRAAPGQWVGVKILTDQSGLMLAEKGIEKAISQHRTADSGSLVITMLC
jgi:hypothetical protein